MEVHSIYSSETFDWCWFKRLQFEKKIIADGNTETQSMEIGASFQNIDWTNENEYSDLRQINIYSN